MIVGVDSMHPYERMLLLNFKQAMERSPDLNETKKLVIEQKIQEIVKVWISKEFM